MKRKTKVTTTRKRATPRVPASEPAIDSSIPAPPIFARPDGFYWQAPDGRQEFGPFETFDEAQADRDAAEEQALKPGETLQEAESEIGIADWIDPETGEPAEGQAPPRFEPE